ncbi:hypothetical protein ALC60_02325 [Trachymyrmex zeteki]|uniref:Uncharacterized protein n=1 Tax=Mycetomoellerius zeteki TaxID=64791 RepID=A0A151XEJ0_9HYME|nr:hypothetical protein ALC60_02325 [Trachymyrmex zeteki]
MALLTLADIYFRRRHAKLTNENFNSTIWRLAPKYLSSCDVGYEMTSQIVGGAENPIYHNGLLSTYIGMIDIRIKESECLCNFYVGWLASVPVFFLFQRRRNRENSRMFSLLRLRFLVFTWKSSTRACTMISQTRPDVQRDVRLPLMFYYCHLLHFH